MNSIKTILITLATLAAGTSATRADDLSELVAAVAASVEKERTSLDMAPAFYSNGKPRYHPKTRQAEINTAMLDGIFSSKKREAFRNMRREIFNEEDDAYAMPNYILSAIFQ